MISFSGQSCSSALRIAAPMDRSALWQGITIVMSGVGIVNQSAGFGAFTTVRCQAS